MQRILQFARTLGKARPARRTRRAARTAPGSPRALPAGLAGCRDRLGCPRGGYLAAAIAVAGDRDAGCAGELDSVACEPPGAAHAETAAHLWHPDSGASLFVLMP